MDKTLVTSTTYGKEDESSHADRAVSIPLEENVVIKKRRMPKGFPRVVKTSTENQVVAWIQAPKAIL